MPDATHTPGPWERCNCFKTGIGIQYAKPGDSPIIVAEVWPVEPAEIGKYIGDDATAQKNAALILAAPDLLASLRSLLECPDLNHDDSDQITLDAIADARAAIAKATGQ